ncbi:MAG TPA: M1 family metallopeptidase [Vicinamibacterales bacterium]|nr:M1 family metallopeptidase [Vicinamibacterales bacterium]
MTGVSKLLAFLLMLAAPAAAQRLPGTVVPEHYTLAFEPDLAKETFRGRESIRVTLTEPGTSITLHAAEITFGEVTITSGGRTQIAKVTTNAKNETATFTVPERLGEGQATIQISYTGVLNDQLRGFYISKANGRKYAVSQMEATDARRAFPSFDEPIYKATYDISMTVPVGDTAISNGKITNDTPGAQPGTHTLTFARTPRMSSYLVALVVGDFACREGASEGVPIRICSTPDKRELTGFALEAAAQQLKFYNDYFGIKYPFGKLDIIGVPDFSAGAMENIGAITFRERLLLIDPATASIGARKRVASVISHEIAHQWFGDLVTMKWWDDIWLNEGFATWMANKPLAAWKPDWHVDLDDAADTQGALGIDAMKSTRAIRMKVETPEEINEVFDGIAYEKTAAVLRMIEKYVGPDAFRKGVASYLKKYSYSNAAGEDFWNEVARVTGKPVDRIMRSFVDQVGAPVLSVRSSCAQNTSNIDVKIARFIDTPGSTPSPQTWTLPVAVKGSNGQTKYELIDRAEGSFKIEGCGATFANADSRGYYLTDYTADTVGQFAKTPSRLTATERISLLGDEWRMVRAGRHDIDLYLDLAAAMAGDDTPVIAETIAERLESISDDIADATERARYQAWIRTHFGPVLTGLGLPGPATDGDDRQYRRGILLHLVGVVGNDPSVQATARELALRYIADPNSVPSTLVPKVLQVAAVDGDAALYQRYLDQMKTASAQPERYYRYFNALSWFSDPALVKRTLEFALSPDVRSQDASTVLGSLLAHPWSSDQAWEFTKNRWPLLVKTLNMFQAIPSLVGSFGSFCSVSRSSDVKEFLAKNSVPSAARAAQQAIEQIDSCVALDMRQSKPFAAWLATVS